jgi:APA family basic amino acid/polyamine antiporter
LSEKKLFVRKATGLVREIGPLTAVIIVLCNTWGAGWQKRVFQFTGPALVPENSYFMGLSPMAFAFLIGGIVVLFSILSYAVLTAAMPRSGGGYVVISRLVHPFVGYMAAWVEFLSISWSFGMIAVIIMETLGNIGAVAGVLPTFNDVTMFWVGVLIVIVFTAIGMLGVRMAGYLLQVMFWIPAALLIYVIVLLGAGAANPSAVAAGVQAITGHTASDYVKAALSQGMATSFTGSYWTAVSVAMLGAYWSYIGYAASTFVAGEVKEANRTLPRTLVLSSILIIVVYMLVSILNQLALKVNVTPDGQWSFFSAYSYLSWGAGSLSKAGLPPIKVWTTAVAGFAASGMGIGYLNILLVIFGVFWVANDIPPFILTASRILFAMSFDRVLPASLSSVNERWHSPLNATVVTGVFALLGCGAEAGVFAAGGSYNPAGNVMLDHVFVSGVVATDLWDGIFFTLFALAMVFFPFRKTQIFDKAPWKLGGKASMALIGIIAFVGNLYLDYAFLWAPGDYFNWGFLLSGQSTDLFSDGFATWFTVFLIVAAGLVYAYYKLRAKTTGVDYSTIFTEIPPE